MSETKQNQLMRNQKNIRELGIKSSQSFTANILGYFIQFVAMIVAGRIFGADVYGEYSYVLSFIMILAIVPRFGMDTGLVSYLSRNTIDEKKKGSILSSSLLLSVCIGLIIIIIIVIFLEPSSNLLLGSNEFSKSLLYLLPFIGIKNANMLLRGALRSKRKIKEIFFTEKVIAPLIRLIFLVIISTLFNIRIVGSLIIAEYIRGLVLLAYLFYKVYRLNMFGRIVISTDSFKFILYSIPLFVSGIIGVAVTNIDKYMIGMMISNSDVAVYRVASMVGTATSFTLGSVNSIFGPMAATLFFDKKLNDLKHLYQTSTKYIMIVNLFIFGIILNLSKDIMQLPGKEFIYGWIALIIVTCGQVVNSSVGSVGLLNSMTGKPIYETYSSVTVLVFNVALNYLLIPKYGIAGAAIATATSLAVKNIVSFILMYKRLKITPYTKKTITIIIVFIMSTLIGYGFSAIINLNYIARIAIIGVLYGAIYLLLCNKYIITENERSIIISRINKVFRKKR